MKSTNVISRDEIRAAVEQMVNTVMGTDPQTKWKAFEVASAVIDEEEDGLSSVNVYAWPVPRPDRGVTVFKFLVSDDGTRHSMRLDSFARACGVKLLDDADQLMGRHFAVRNEGRSADDFARLESAITQVRT